MNAPTITVPGLERLTWHRCTRCGEPIDPANVATESPAWPAPGSRRYVHPGRASGCLAAAKDLARADYDRAMARVMARLTAPDPVTAAATSANRNARCDHRGRSCLDRLEPDPWAEVAELPPTRRLVAGGPLNAEADRGL
jgi:hypothetical protein